MFKFTPNTSRRSRNITTRGGSDTSKTSIVIRNDNDEDGEEEAKANRLEWRRHLRRRHILTICGFGPRGES